MRRNISCNDRSNNLQTKKLTMNISELENSLVVLLQYWQKKMWALLSRQNETDTHMEQWWESETLNTVSPPSSYGLLDLDQRCRQMMDYHWDTEKFITEFSFFFFFCHMIISSQVVKKLNWLHFQYHFFVLTFSTGNNGGPITWMDKHLSLFYPSHWKEHKNTKILNEALQLHYFIVEGHQR